MSEVHDVTANEGHTCVNGAKPIENRTNYEIGSLPLLPAVSHERARVVHPGRIHTRLCRR